MKKHRMSKSILKPICLATHDMPFNLYTDGYKEKKYNEYTNVILMYEEYKRSLKDAAD